MRSGSGINFGGGHWVDGQTGLMCKYILGQVAQAISKNH
jgi:hypothetical protein